MVTVDFSRLPSLKENEDAILEEKKSLQASNKGCPVSEALKMEKEYVHADGNCLFNCATLALENTV